MTKFEPIPSYGDHITMKTFLEWVRTGCIIDYDGHGKYATDKQMTDITVFPSDVKSKKLDKSFSHIVWFNK